MHLHACMKIRMLQLIMLVTNFIVMQMSMLHHAHAMVWSIMSNTCWLFAILRKRTFFCTYGRFWHQHELHDSFYINVNDAWTHACMLIIYSDHNVKIYSLVLAKSLMYSKKCPNQLAVHTTHHSIFSRSLFSTYVIVFNGKHGDLEAAVYLDQLLT